MGSSASKTSSYSSDSLPETKLNSKLSSTTAPRPFSFPMPSIHHPPVKKGDTHHFVSLTSTTYGSLLLDRQTLPHLSVSGKNQSDQKTLSETEEPRASLSPDSVINTWELMNGLDDESDTSKRNSTVNSESCSKPITKMDESYELLRFEDDDEDWIPLSHKPKQPLWKHLSEETFLSDLDPNIISSYKRALSSKLGKSTKTLSCSNSNQSVSQESVDQEIPRLLETEDKNNNKIVLYFTSLRGIRKTYEDCCSVRAILRGFQVAVEERDISMDSNYRKELQNALGEEKPVCLPQVFIRGVRIGGIEEIKILNDGGELGEMLKEFPISESVGACENCGDARFVPCTDCGGSTKVFEEVEDGFKRCERCNENGLVRCNKCCL